MAVQHLSIGRFCKGWVGREKDAFLKFQLKNTHGHFLLIRSAQWLVFEMQLTARLIQVGDLRQLHQGLGLDFVGTF